MPKISRGITNVKNQEAYYVNSSGTEYTVKFTDPGFDKQICAPAKQVIDYAAWIQEAMSAIQNGVKTK